MMARRWVAGVTIGVLTLAGCVPAPTPDTRTTAPSCADLPARIVDAVQDYVDSFAATTSSGVGGAVTARQADFAEVTAALNRLGEELGCDREELATGVRQELTRLRGGTPLQDAIADTFRAGPLGTADPSDLGPLQLGVGTADELVAALAVAGSGSVIRIAGGEYRLSQPLVMLRPVTLVGAGAAATVLVSTAADAALVLATDGDAVVRDLAIAHEGPQPASVVLVAGGGYVLERLRIDGGAAVGSGGYGVVLRPASNPLLGTGTRRVLDDVTLVGTPAGGVVVAGEEAPTIRDVSVTGSAGCGLCFVERSAGTVSGATISDTQVGVRVDDEAAPDVGEATVTRSEVGVALTGSGATRVTGGALRENTTGIQVTGDGPAVVAGVTVADSVDVGVRVSGSARPTLSELLVTGSTPVGVAVVGQAAPTCDGGRVETTGEVGMIWAERGAGTATGVSVVGPRLALQLSDDASPTLVGVTAAAAAGALLANGRSAGTVDLSCTPGDGALVALADQTTTAVTAGVDCRLVDER